MLGEPKALTVPHGAQCVVRLRCAECGTGRLERAERVRCTPAVIADEEQGLHPDIRACDGTSLRPASGRRGTAGWLARIAGRNVGVGAKQSGRAV